MALTFQKHHGKHLWVIVYHIRVQTPQSKVSRGLGSLGDHEGSCTSSDARQISMYRKEDLPLGKAKARLQNELVLDPGTTCTLLLLA